MDSLVVKELEGVKKQPNCGMQSAECEMINPKPIALLSGKGGV
jgi:hypothetical protein